MYLDSIQSQLYYSTLLRSECFGLFTNHVLLKTRKETTHKWPVHLMPGPERDGVKNMLYLQLGQLSQLLCSIKDELSALEETGRQRDRWKKSAVVIITIKSSCKWLSVKQKTSTFLTHSFTVTLSRFTDVKLLFPSSAAIILICVLFVSKNYKHTCMHTHVRTRAHTHIHTHSKRLR